MEDYDKFVIQRRNLIIINCILIIFSFTDIKEPKFSFIGLTFNLNQNINLYTIIIVIWSYLLIRYLSTLSFKIYNSEINFKDKFRPTISDKILLHMPIKNIVLVKLLLPLIIIFIFLPLWCLEILILFSFYLFNKNIHEYIFPILFSLFSFSTFVVNNIKIIGIEYYQNMVILLIIIMIAGVINFGRALDNKNIKKNSDYYKENGKSKKRKDNI